MTDLDSDRNLERSIQRHANQTVETVKAVLNHPDEDRTDIRQSEADEKQRILSREKAVNTFLQIKKICRPQPGQEFSVITYFLTEKISPEGCHGMWFLVGAYPRKDMAVEKAEELIRETGIHSIYAMRTCDWQNIDDNFAFDRTTFVPANRDKDLRDKHAQQYQQMVKDVKREENIKDQMEEEQERESDPDSLQHYIRQWFLTIKNRSDVEYHRLQMEQSQGAMDKRLAKLREAYQTHPEYEDQWIPDLQGKLPQRNEQALLDSLIKGHQLLKPLLKK